MTKSTINIFRLFLTAFLIINLIGPLLMLFSSDITLNNNWQTANRDSTGIAPKPDETTEAVVQVYAARAFNWRGIFAVHTWIATKEKNANEYTIHHVLGWNARRGLPVVVSKTDSPDRSWYGYTPEIIQDIRGGIAESLIPRIAEAATSYPYQDKYVLWPGPNSNTFIAHIGRHVPELKLDLPSSAIGKDYLLNGHIISTPPSGTGFQISVFGLFGILASQVEGIEINFLGLVSGINLLEPAIKLPGIGKIKLN
jgi:hypothetical protein